MVVVAALDGWIGWMDWMDRMEDRVGHVGNVMCGIQSTNLAACVRAWTWALPACVLVG